MTRLTRRLGPLAIAFAIALPGTAIAQQYLCTLTSATSNWIPPEFLIDYSGSTATVSHGWLDGPAVNTVQIRGNADRRRLNYSLVDAQAINGQRAVMTFQLTHTVASERLSVRLNPVAYSNSFSGNGTCTPA